VSGQSQWSWGDYALALAFALKGHDAAKRLRRGARSMPRDGVRQAALRGLANAADQAADQPIQTVNAIRRARAAPQNPDSRW
jgi:hypothetical protein